MSAKANVVEQILTLKWIIPEDKLIRFEEMPEAYVISDKVAEFDFSKAGVTKGTKVNVKIEKNGEEGTVVFMTKVKGQTPAPKEETKTEQRDPVPTNTSTATASTDNTKELTVNGLAKGTRGIIFAEQDKVWYTLAQDIDVEGLYAKGVRKGAKVKVTVVPPEGRSKNEIITSITVVEEVKKQWSGKKSYKSDYDNPERQRSIESQAAVNAANRVVASMVTATTDAETVLKMIRKIAEANLTLIDELKSK